jgi:UDP-N-acetylmuramoyl-tripeptide--D-alanyl-D-alanine ligase
MKAAFRAYILRRIWAKALLRARLEKPYVITLTGTVGKTSAKEALAGILALTDRPIVKTLGNMASDAGVPLSLLGYDEQPADVWQWFRAAFLLRPQIITGQQPYYILEFSADKPGDIAFLAKQFPANAAVLTAITPAHMANYPDFEDLVNEKFSLLDGVSEDGYVVLNADDAAMRGRKYKDRAVVWYGIAKGAGAHQAGVWAHNVKYTAKGIVFDLSFGEGKKMDNFSKDDNRIQIKSQVIGVHQLYPLLAAAAVAFQEGLTPALIKKGLEEYKVPNGRGKIIPGKRDITIIDDTYNSSPDAVKAGLQMLRPIAGDRRVVAILGTMNELGESAEQAHKDIAAAAAKKVDFLIAIGPFQKQMLAAAQAAGMKGFNTHGFDTPEQLMRQIGQVIQGHDVVYIKASQNAMRLERVVQLLMDKPDQAAQLLVRQHGYWKGKS